MRKATLCLCLLVATIDTSAQNDAWWEDFNKSSVQQSKQKKEELETLDKKEKGFVAPTDGALTLAYDRQIYVLRGPGSEDGDPLRLNGVKIGGTIHGRIKGAIGMEVPILFRIAHRTTDNPYDDNLESQKGNTMGVQMGLMLCTSYRFRRRCYITFAFGPKLDFTMFSMQKDVYPSGMTAHYDFISGDGWAKYNGETLDLENDNLKQNKVFDMPFSLGTTFRYKAVGISLHYDIGTINRLKEAYYRQTGTNSDYIKRRDHFLTLGLQFYLGKGEMNK